MGYAICIDQGNQVERLEQVAIMGAIHETAKSVTVFVGEANARSDRALETLRYLIL